MTSIPSLDLLRCLRDFRRTWPQLVLTDLLARALAVALIAPLVTLLVKLFLMRADQGVLADADIALFLLRPVGVTALIVVGSVALATLFVSQGSLMVIGFGAMEDRLVTWLDAVRYVIRHARALVRLGGAGLVRLLLVAIPFLAALVGVYFLLLGTYDINYYLSNRPPEFLWAVGLAGIIVATLAIVVLRLVSGWILALPLTLFEGSSGTMALRESARRTAGVAWGIAIWIAAWLALIALVSAAVSFLTGTVGGLVIPEATGENFLVVAVGVALTLLASAAATVALNVVATSYFPLVLVRLHRTLGGVGRLDPPIADRDSLASRPTFGVAGKRFLMAAGLIMVGLLAAGYVVFRSMDRGEDVTIIAHRGASRAAPENTLAAFEEAIAQSTDWIELDVQESAEGVVIVAHDSDFMKVARNRLKVWDATTEALRDIDIGGWFRPEFSAERTPTLREALELARNRAGVVIELKYYGHDEQLEARVADVVESVGMQSQVMVMSLERRGIAKFAALRPSWPHGLLNTASVGDLTRLNVDFLALNAKAATPGLIRRAHRRGVQVYVWTVNDPLQMSVLMSRGVDGIITDEPGVARRVLELRANLGAFGRLVVWVAGETGLLRVDEPLISEEDA